MSTKKFSRLTRVISTPSRRLKSLSRRRTVATPPKPPPSTTMRMAPPELLDAIGLITGRIERHHGRLWAEPNVGPGATFSLSIPCDAKAMTSRGEASGPLDTKV